MGVALLCYYLGKMKSNECDQTARLFYDELWKGSYDGCAEGGSALRLLAWGCHKCKLCTVNIQECLSVILFPFLPYLLVFMVSIMGLFLYSRLYLYITLCVKFSCLYVAELTFIVTVAI